jgi:hypothetical protein
MQLLSKNNGTANNKRQKERQSNQSIYQAINPSARRTIPSVK